MSRKSYTLDDMKLAAEMRLGKCLSDSYINMRSPLQWECVHGHKWFAEPRSVVAQGSWCRECFIIQRADLQRHSLKEMNLLAEPRGGRCLSKEYVNTSTKLKWVCKFGHEWEAKPTDVKQGRWCPVCSTGLKERICRVYFEELFGFPFPKSRPGWLINSRGNQMELDGFCKELMLAFEHQGEQHYTLKTHYLKSKTELTKRKEDDDKKVELCKEHGIHLVIVPEIGSRTKEKNLLDVISTSISNSGTKIRIPANIGDININKAYQTNGAADELKHLNILASAKSGRCLSFLYKGTWKKLDWECEFGHVWKATPNNIKQGTWCPKCQPNQQLSIDEMHHLAKKRNGKCLSNSMTNSKQNLEWECEFGHVWKATSNNVKRGKWCPICAVKRRSSKRRLTIDDIQSLAIEKNGACLSDKYINARTKLLWKCQYGHQWEATQSDVKQGKWCPACGRKEGSSKLKLNFDELKYLAIKRGGKCLSKHYVNVKTHLKWECKEGHTWEAIPESIRRGSWCPICSRNKNT